VPTRLHLTNKLWPYGVLAVLVACGGNITVFDGEGGFGGDDPGGEGGTAGAGAAGPGSGAGPSTTTGSGAAGPTSGAGGVGATGSAVTTTGSGGGMTTGPTATTSSGAGGSMTVTTSSGSGGSMTSSGSGGVGPSSSSTGGSMSSGSGGSGGFPVGPSSGAGGSMTSSSSGSGGAGGSACDHEPCVLGDALDAMCGMCEASICAVDPFCCTASWDGICVNEAESMCPAECPSCHHDICTTGDPLGASCDPCAATVCMVDPTCCTTAWDGSCLQLVDTACGIMCP
jgi:hypothetical protein